MATPSFRRCVEQELGKFPNFLIYAVLEGILIIILFINGFLAFLANEFAKFFELRLPCLLCTRIDHVLVRRNPDFYYNESVCEAHKKEVSYLAYCHVHRKLSDIRKMCEGCLLSFATEKESDTGTYKSLVGILHKDLECFVEDDHQIQLKLPSGRKDDDVKVEESSVHRCSCCGVPLKVKSSSTKEIGNGSANKRSLLSHTPAPSPRAPFVSLKNEESRSLELPHIRYTELKFVSDNDPDMPEDEDGTIALIRDNQGKDDVKAVTMPLLTESEDMNEDPLKTPKFFRANRFFGIPLTDSGSVSASASASASPRWTSRILRKSPLEKTEFASDSIEANSIEIDGESILHRLKRQVRLDRKSLMALYMELDEERSASAVAANNAMAMITRLQAEKAAVQMEALQYQRMMEEQAEYDQEAFQVMKDFLTKKDDELKVLEAELEAYREKYGTIREDGIEESQNTADTDYQEYIYQSHSPCSEISEIINHCSFNEHDSNRVVSSREENGGETYEQSSLDFLGERSYLLDQLNKMERKLQFSSCNVDHKDEDRGFGNKAKLTRELSDLTERVKAIDEDIGFSKHAAQEIQGPTVVKLPLKDTDA